MNKDRVGNTVFMMASPEQALVKSNLPLQWGTRLTPRVSVLIAVLVILCATRPLTAEPLKDDRGVNIEIKRVPERIAAISTFGADLSLAMGKVPVAVTRSNPQQSYDFLDMRLRQAMNIGPRGQVNLELLSQVNPDLIVAVRRYTESQAEQLQSIAPYIAFDLVTLEDSLRAVAIAGRAMGQAARAEQLNEDFRQLLADYRAKAPGELSAALLVSTAETPYIYYNHFLSARLLTELGAVNVGGESPHPDQRLPLGYRISLEQLLELDPDVIFLFASNKERAFTHNPIWPYLSAVKHGRVYEVGHHWKEGAGPQTRALILKDMAHLLYPGVFAVPDMPESARGRRYQ